MISAGKTAQVQVTDIMVGRKLLCPKASATRACAKQLTKTITAAKKGLTPKQQKLWQKYVFAPAVLQAKRHCDNFGYVILPGTGVKPPTNAQLFATCVAGVLSGKMKFNDIFKKGHIWSEYLIKGAKLLKGKTTNIFGNPNPYRGGRVQNPYD